ncbi:MAG: LacI family DNA-binding transcriptional regulator [Planctomycetota bacterium]
MPERRIKNVTLRDVAEVVGVSAMTVSRALSGKSHLLNPETAKRCREAADELGYVPNLMARSLRGEELHTIVMFAEFISAHHYLAEVVDAVSRSIEDRKYGVISCQSTSSLHQALRNFKLAGAVIIAPPERFYDQPLGGRSTSRERRSSAVVIHSAVHQHLFHEVSPDIEAFSYAAARHLIDLGHRHIGYLGGPRPEDEANWFHLRRRGIERAMRERDVPLDCLRQQACPDADLGPAAVQQLLTRAPQTTAVICINDEIAIAAMTGAQKLGMQVPRDFSVVGCNDIQLARFFTPALTTFKIDIRAMVETALDLLFDQICDRRLNAGEERVRILLPASLVTRDSTAPPPARS